MPTPRRAHAAPRSRATVLVGLLVAAACSTPIGVVRLNPRQVDFGLTRSVLSSGEPSDATVNVLYRRGLMERWEDAPADALSRLHALVRAGSENRDDVFALAELSFALGQETQDRARFLASAVYAFAFLFPEAEHEGPDPLDPRLRIAADLYNRGVTGAFASPNRRFVELVSGPRSLPFGTLEVAFDEADLVVGRRRITNLFPVADMRVRGLATRYRRPGIGAPLAANAVPVQGDEFDDFVVPWAKLPVTALLRLERPRAQLRTEVLTATLDLVPSSQPVTTMVEDREVPVEAETTAALAYTLAESPVWQQEIAGFLESAGIIDPKSRLAALRPYQPGRIPIVFVHGTASSAGRWAQMFNELMHDPRIESRFTFWLFSYTTGNPVPYSAALLRDSLMQAVARLDPEGKDAALRQMVVIGHSQGGLLTKLTAVDCGDVFWPSKRPFDDYTASFSPDTRELLRRMVFFTPLPPVRRVIFLATPHRGSYFAGNWLAHLVARFVTLPIDMVRAGTDLVSRDPALVARLPGGRFPTAVDNMTPGNAFIRTLSSLPIAPGIAVNSIVAVQGDGPMETGDDGIVEYTSAHLDDVESEVVVRSGHSCQDNPDVIEEVRRILVTHAAAVDAETRPPVPAVRPAGPRSRPRRPRSAPSSRSERAPSDGR